MSHQDEAKSAEESLESVLVARRSAALRRLQLACDGLAFLTRVQQSSTTPFYQPDDTIWPGSFSSHSSSFSSSLSSSSSSFSSSSSSSSSSSLLSPSFLPPDAFEVVDLTGGPEPGAEHPWTSTSYPSSSFSSTSSVIIPFADDLNAVVNLSLTCKSLRAELLEAHWKHLCTKCTCCALMYSGPPNKRQRRQ